MFMWFFKDKIILLGRRPSMPPSYQTPTLPKFASLLLLRQGTCFTTWALSLPIPTSKKQKRLDTQAL